jgi:hypothetical protein
MPYLRQSRINVPEGVTPKNVNWMDLIRDEADSFHTRDLDGQVKVCENVKFDDDHFIQIEKYIDTRNNDIQNEENRNKMYFLGNKNLDSTMRPRKKATITTSTCNSTLAGTRDTGLTSNLPITECKLFPENFTLGPLESGTRPMPGS